jgi:acyl carrier protein
MNNILSEKDTRAVLDILIEELGVEEAQLTPDARLQHDLGADSLTLVEITMVLEDRFNLSIPDEEWGKVSTVEDLFEALGDLLEKPELRRA